MMTIVRNTKLYAMLVAAAFSLTSCLDKVPGSAIPEEEALQTYQEAEQFLTGIYASMMSGSLWSGYLTLVPEIQSDLAYAVEGYSNVYGNIWQWDIRPTNAEIEAIYGSLYSLIANCNFFLERVDQIIAKQTIDENIQALDYYKGEVYAIRALCYSELIKCFCKAYDPATAQNELGVVLRTKYSTPESSRRASLADSYALVLDDLQKAEELLDVENDYYGAFYMTNASVCALRARVALNMQDWQTAIDYATKLIDHPQDTFALANANVAYTPQLSYFDYMWQHDQAFEIIWQVGFTPTSYGGALGSIFLNVTTDYTYYYPDYVPAQWVLDLYQSGDMRYNTYFATLPTGYDHALTWPLLVKYYGNKNFISSMIYHVSMPKPFRLAEQYLIRAEAYCRKGNYSAASADLSTLSQSRYQAGGGISVNAGNWLQTISDERVRELYMEGFRLHDLKRWGLGFEHTPQAMTQSEGSSLKISADNPLFVWPIPNHEVSAPGSQIQPNESNR